MNRITSRFVSTLGLASLVGMLIFVAAAPAKAGVIAYWKFEGSGGTELADSSGNGNSLNNTNVTFSADVASTAFNSTQSATFNGTSAFLKTAANVGFSAANASKQMTIEWFMKPAATNALGLLFEGNAPNHAANGTFGAYIQNNTELHYGHFSASNNDHVVWTFDPPAWHHYAIEVDETNPNGITVGTPGTDTEVLLYRDGTLVGQTSVPGAGVTSAVTFADAVMPLGARSDGAGNSFFFKGEIDDMRISTGLLNPSQFLDVALPEPASVSLLGVAGLLMMRRRQSAKA